jgi:hypothetical protein
LFAPNLLLQIDWDASSENFHGGRLLPPSPKLADPERVPSPLESKEISLLEAALTVSHQEQEEVESFPIAEELSPYKSVDQSEDEDFLLLREEEEPAGGDS